MTFSSLISAIWRILVSAVDFKASAGQGRNQSMVVQFTSPGKVLILFLKVSPTGEKQSTICRFSLQVLTKWLNFWLLVPEGTSSDTASMILVRSSPENRLGTSPLFNIPQISSTWLSFVIWVSLNKKTVYFLSMPAIFITLYSSSCHIFASIWITSIPAIYVDSVARDLRPLPPTPTNRAWPKGVVTIRTILIICEIAFKNNTKFILLDG